MLTRFSDFVEEDGSPVVDRVEKGRMRPLPPAGPGAPFGAYPPASRVDVRSNDCWWEGELQAVTAGTAAVKVTSASRGAAAHTLAPTAFRLAAQPPPRRMR